MPAQTRLTILLASTALVLMSCQSFNKSSTAMPTDFEALQDASDAYLAYERGDCITASRLSDPIRIAPWQPAEVRHSMILLNGFCKELEGDLGKAQAIYKHLIAEAPGSFAARDAKERSRIIRINESDPDHAAWMRDAEDRALTAKSKKKPRKPVERIDPLFPPIARSAGIEGYAVIEFGVTSRGTTSDPIVVESSPPLIFDGASVRAIRNWKYTRRPAAASIDIHVIRLVYLVDGFKQDAFATPETPDTPEQTDSDIEDQEASTPTEEPSAESD